MRVQRFNKEGMKKFSEYLDSLKSDFPEDYPDELLENPALTRYFYPEIEIEPASFDTRFDAGEYFFRLFTGAGIHDVGRDAELWAWMTLYFFNEVCPEDEDGIRTVRDKARYYPEFSNYKKAYRHLLADPYRIYHAYQKDPERALVMLSTPVHAPGDLAEQFASRHYLVMNPVLIETATRLYIVPDSRKPKRGATRRDTGGDARRLVNILGHYDRTWDVASMTVDHLIAMLPSEFDEFKS